MIGGYGIGNIFQQNGLTGLWRSHNQGALPFAYGGEHIHNAGGNISHRARRDVEFLLREEGSEMLKGNPVAHCYGVLAVYAQYFAQREVFLSVAGRIHRTFHHIAGLQGILLYEVLSHIDVIGTCQIIVIA